MTAVLPYQEKALLSEVAAGNETAFTQLFHHWQDFLATHIFRITDSRELAEEIVQDVFLKIWMTRETLTGIESFKAYLIVVSRNQALNALKKTLREFEKRNLYGKEIKHLGAGPDTDATEIMQHALIDEAIDKLSPRQKEVYLLHRHQRLTYPQIAEQLGIGRESVKTHMELAIKAITKHVKGRLTVLILLLELHR